MVAQAQDVDAPQPLSQVVDIRNSPLIDKRCSAVLQEVSHKGRLISGGTRDRNRMMTQGIETMI